MLTQAQTRTRILSQVLDYVHRQGWQDSDDFTIRFVDKLEQPVKDLYVPYGAVWEATRTKTTFFVRNHISRKQFCASFIKEVQPYLKEIGASSSLGSLTFSNLFPETETVGLDDAERLVSDLGIDERVIQDTLRRRLRELGATNMIERKSDTSLEVADIEDFTLRVSNRDVSFSCVVKGFNSVSGKSVTAKDVAHQIMKAYDGTFPDYVLLVLAKPPTDSLITHLVRFGQIAGNRNLVILADTISLARFLRANRII